MPHLGTSTVTREELAALFECSPKTISRWLARGRLPCVRVPGNKYLVTTDLLILVKGTNTEHEQEK
jgi:excisionase family DNA binding protein